ncbi:MAG: hypothetical protein HFH14_05695 [Lachnospiraceae bacterium]|nr:hypothetical protein [Lachnospiraceae bacterium]
MIHKTKRKKLLLTLYSVVMTLGFVGLLAVPTGGSAKLQYSGEKLESEPEIPDEEIKEITDSSSTFSFEGTDFLVKDAYPEINKLVNDYYNAMMNYDMDSMESLVSDIARVDKKLILAKLEYMQSISNIICYTVEGPVEGTFRVYVYYDLQLKGIDTLAPALSAMYVTMSSDGNYVIYLSEIDDEAQDFIEEADGSVDVELLSSLVSERLNNVINSDASMKEFYNMMESAVSTGAGDTDNGGQDAAQPPSEDAGNADAPADNNVPAVPDASDVSGAAIQ